MGCRWHRKLQQRIARVQHASDSAVAVSYSGWATVQRDGAAPLSRRRQRAIDAVKPHTKFFDFIKECSLNCKGQRKAAQKPKKAGSARKASGLWGGHRSAGGNFSPSTGPENGIMSSG